MFVQFQPTSVQIPMTCRAKYLCGRQLLNIVVTLLFAPVCCVAWALSALAILPDSSGPIFSRQTRIGQHGQAFSLLEFRPMVVHHKQTLHRAVRAGPASTSV
ncbi:MAG TPA: sugar transferase [Ktedonobacteraceae bacterium]